MGGGMGHLYRTKIFIKQAGYVDYKIVTANPLVRNLFEEDAIILLEANHYERSWTDFVNEILPQLAVEAFYIDSFPWGIVHELSSVQFNAIPIYYIARRLRWEVYCHSKPPGNIIFERTYCIEPLENVHATFVQQYSKEVTTLDLPYPQAQMDKVQNRFRLDAKPLWLIVHASNQQELRVLYEYAREVAQLNSLSPFFLVISDQVLEGLEDRCITYTPAVDWFPLADRIFCGAGFNTVQQALPYWHKVSFWPFPRKYDDQAWRLAYWQNKLT